MGRSSPLCKTHVLAVELVHQLLISNPLELRAPVVPALAERASRPLVGNRTRRGRIFRALGSGRTRVTLTW
jgi:hypothetical protein